MLFVYASNRDVKIRYYFTVDQMVKLHFHLLEGCIKTRDSYNF